MRVRLISILTVFLLAFTALLAFFLADRAASEVAAAEAHRAGLAADTMAEAMQAVLDDVRDRYDLPGVTAAYATVGGSSGTAATGWADVEAGRRMTPDARMLAASIGKTFVAATAVALHHEGVLDLDAPIARHLGDRPWFPELPNRDAITMRHLLAHRAGLPDHVHTDAFAEAVAQRWQEPGHSFPPDTLVAFVLGNTALFPPGDGWSYSDTGYVLAGLIIEEATGRAYYDLVTERFLAPLGLHHTEPSDRRELAGLAAGYSAENAFGWPEKSTGDDGALRWHPGIEWTGGGLVSTSSDLAAWGVALFGGTALPAEARAMMLDAAPVDPAEPDVGYGLGVAVYRAGRIGPVYGHGGWIPGYVSSLRYYAGPGVAVAFQINTDDGLETDSTSAVRELETRLAEIVVPRG
jgi:D-alanyl-D-alanine carboxypeptidase